MAKKEMKEGDKVVSFGGQIAKITGFKQLWGSEHVCLELNGKQVPGAQKESYFFNKKSKTWDLPDDGRGH